MRLVSQILGATAVLGVATACSDAEEQTSDQPQGTLNSSTGAELSEAKEYEEGKADVDIVKPATEEARVVLEENQTNASQTGSVVEEIVKNKGSSSKPESIEPDAVVAKKLELSQVQSRIQTLSKNLTQLTKARKQGGKTAAWRIKIATLEQSVQLSLENNTAKKKELETELNELLDEKSKQVQTESNIILVDTQAVEIKTFAPKKRQSLMDRMTEQTTVDAAVFEPVAASISQEDLDAELKRIEKEMVGILGR